MAQRGEKEKGKGERGVLTGDGGEWGGLVEISEPAPGRVRVAAGHVSGPGRGCDVTFPFDTHAYRIQFAWNNGYPEQYDAQA
jgi:hypothetical protein